MPDFLLEIGCEEIPARMIDAASQELRERVHKLLDRERLLPAGAITLSRYSASAGGAGVGIPAAQPDVTEQADRAIGQRCLQRWTAHSARRRPLPKKPAWMFRNWKNHYAKGEYLAAKITKKGRAAAEILAELSSQRNRFDLLAQEYVLAQAERALRASGALAGGDARCRGYPAGV